jgi:hypothetical protein
MKKVSGFEFRVEEQTEVWRLKGIRDSPFHFTIHNSQLTVFRGFRVSSFGLGQSSWGWAK